MSVEISIILPAIRPDKWDEVYDSICNSTKREFELIIVSPYPLTSKLQPLKNVKYVKDFGSPVRASNIGAMLCEGNLITWSADDCLFQVGALDRNIDELYNMKYNYKNVVVSKYYEGEDNNKPLQEDLYFKVNGSTCTASPHIPNSYWLFNVAIIYKEFFYELGGWDCKFEACPMAHTDMAIRAQANGAVVKMTDYPLLDCGHMPGTSGDHAPIHFGQILHDEPLFQKIYRNRFPVDLLDLSINNWKNAPKIWERRFLI